MFATPEVSPAELADARQATGPYQPGTQARTVPPSGAPAGRAPADGQSRDLRPSQNWMPSTAASLQRDQLATATSPGSATGPACFPLRLGVGRANYAKSLPDSRHGDNPPISAVSEAALRTWAFIKHGRTSSSDVTNAECESDMDSTLTEKAKAAGHDAFARFKAGTGGTVVLGPGTELNRLALVSPSFRRTVAEVRDAIGRNLASQVSRTGIVDPCAVSIGTIPETKFPLLGPDPEPLQAVIGGTQGEELFLTGLTAWPSIRIFNADLHFRLYDTFGVDEDDLYAPSLAAFWMLQHRRSTTMYIPFINQLDLTITTGWWWF
jgi:hypothetical protein